LRVEARRSGKQLEPEEEQTQHEQARGFERILLAREEKDREQHDADRDQRIDSRRRGHRRYPSLLPARRGEPLPLAPRVVPSRDGLRPGPLVVRRPSDPKRRESPCSPFSRRGPSTLPRNRLQIAEEIRVRIEHQRRVVADRPVALERLEERIELGILAERLAVDPRRFRVGGTDDLLRAPLGLRANPPELPLHLAENLLAAAFAFRAEARRDAAPLRDHSLFDLLAHLVDIVDALDPDVDQLDAELRHQARRGLEHLVLELLATLLWALEVGFRERVDFLLGELRDVDLPVGRADDLLELGVRDDVARHGIEDVVEPAPRADLVADGAKELQRVDDSPARRRVDDDEFSSERRNLTDVAVPAEQALVEAAYLLDERDAPMQSGLVDDVADRLAELNDDALLGLVD